MSSNLEELDKKKSANQHNVPLKRKGVIKLRKDASKKTIKLKPIKTFNQATTIQEPLAAGELSGNDNSNPVELDASREELEHTQVTKNQETNVDTYTVMKRNINEEMNQYREMQIKAIQEELRQLRETAKQEGYDAGYEEGKVVFQDYSKNLFNSINELGKSKKEDLDKKRDFTIDLSLAIAEHIIGHQIQKDEAVFETLFMNAIDKITEKDYVAITINPEDKSLLDSLREKFEDKFKDMQRLDVHTDTSMVSGGCTIETNLGFIDATVTSKLAILKQAIDEFHEKENEQITNIVEKEEPIQSAVAENSAQSADGDLAQEIEMDEIRELDNALNDDMEEIELDQEDVYQGEDSYEGAAIDDDDEEEEEEEEEEDEEEDDDEDDEDDDDLFAGLDLSDFDDTFDEFK